jgi:hypothetical protein
MTGIIWGWFVYNWLHVAPLAAQAAGIPFHEWYALFVSALQVLADYLLCPACVTHFRQYILDHPPTGLKSYEEVFKWTVDFHNSVNVRTGKAQYTVKEAKQMLYDRFQVHMLDVEKNPESLTGAYLLDYWVLLCLFAPRMIGVDRKESEESQKADFKVFLSCVIRTMPFAHRLTPDGDRVGDILAAKIEDMNTKDQVTVMDELLAMYNSQASLFGTMEMTRDSWWKLFYDNTQNPNVEHQIMRTDAQRKEDHKKIMQLQKELAAYKESPLRNGAIVNRTGEDGLDSFEIAVIVIGSLVGLLLLYVVGFYLGYWGTRTSRTRTSGPRVSKNGSRLRQSSRQFAKR